MIRHPFRTSLLCLALSASLFGTACAGAASRRFEKDYAAEDIKTLNLDGGVGEIRVSASDDGRIHVKVEVKSGDDAWFSKDTDLDEVELKADEDGDELNLSVDGEDIAEDWELAVPAGIALRIDHGVGEVRITGVSGDIDVDLGVGELDIEAEEQAVARAALDVGVGDADIEGGQASSRSAMPIAQELRYEGKGEQEIRADLGVGDAKLSLR